MAEIYPKNLAKKLKGQWKNQVQEVVVEAQIKEK